MDHNGEDLAVEPRGELAARTLAMPGDTNPKGDIFGGWIMALMDAAGAMTASGHARGFVATIAVSNIAFLQPVRPGDVVCCYTEITRIGKTSMTLNIEVWVRRTGHSRRIKVSQADFTFVAVSDDGRPRRISD
jgi:acyl-CoA thioesterase YciA